MDFKFQDKINTEEMNNETSVDINNTPIEIEEPLSPVLTTSKKSVKHIARRKSRIKLQNKFSQLSSSSQEIFSSLETQSQLEENSNSILNTEKQNVEEETKNTDLEKRMKKCLEMQKNKKFCYNIVKSSMNEVNTDENNVISEICSDLEESKSFISNVNVLNKENDFNFKVPVSPISTSKVKQNNVEISPILHPIFDFNVGFETGSGKKINLSERALKRASKLFDDIIEIPSDTSNHSENVNLKINNTNICRTSLKKGKGIISSTNEELPINNCVKEIITDNEIKEISQDNKNIFTQITDTQMCWAAENAECLVEFMNTQWTPSPKYKSSTCKQIQKTENDFESFSSPECEQLFGNLTICEDGTLITRNKNNENDDQLDLDKSQQLFKDHDSMSNNCCGFTWNDSLKSLKIFELYKRSFKHVENNMKKKIFYPLSYTFSYISSSKEYKNKKYKYVFRTRKKSDFVYTFGGIKYIRKSKKLSVSQESNVVTRSRRSINNSFYNEITTINADTDKFSSSNESYSNCKSIKKTIKDLEDEFLSSIEGSVNISDNSKIDYQMKDIEDIKNEIKLENGASNKIIELKETLHIEENKNSENTITISEENLTKTNKIFADFDVSAGFSTASGKKVEISEEFLQKTKKLFQDCNIIEELNKNNPNCINLSEISKEIQEQSVNISLNESNAVFEEKFINKNELLVSDIKASGKKVKIESLQKAKMLFQDCNIEEQDKEDATTNNCSLNEIFDDKNDISIDSEDVNTVSNFTVGKNVKIPEECLQNNINYNEAKLNVKLDFASATEKTITFSEDSINKVKNSFLDSDMTFGFSTAGGKKVKISETSLQKAKMLFQDCDNISDLDNSDIKLNNSDTEKHISDVKNISKHKDVGFSTAGGKKVEISETSLEKAKQMFAELDNNTGQSVKISENSLEKQKMFLEDFNNSTGFQQNICGFSTASGKKVDVSEKSLEKAKEFFQEPDNLNLSSVENNTVHQNSNIICGFSTASGKKVDVSEESLEKAKEFFQEPDNLSLATVENNTLHQNSNICGFSTASGKKVDVSEESLEKAKEFFQEADNLNLTSVENNAVHQNSNIICGFSTASGKKVDVSEESLEKAKEFFQEPDNLNLTSVENNAVYQNSNICGFSTASGKKVDVSEKSLRKAKEFFQEPDNLSLTSMENNAVHQNPNIICGFSTASGKKVDVSEESLVKAKEFFQEPDNLSLTSIENNAVHQNPNIICGFSTASGKKVDVSETSLEKAKEFFQGADNLNLTSVENNTVHQKSNIICGFATASGHKVNISEESVQKAKMIFQDCNDDTEFQNNINIKLEKSETKSEKDLESIEQYRFPVNVSDEVLNQAKNKLESVIDVDMSKKMENQHTPVLKSNITDVTTNKTIKSEYVNKHKPSSAISTNKSYSSPQITINNTTPVLRNRTLSVRNSKKRSLGVNSCKQLDISENSLKRAKLIFDDIDSPKKNEPIINNNHLNCSPLPNKINTSIAHTPQNLDLKCIPKTISNKSLINTTVTIKESNQIKTKPTPKISPQKNICMLNENNSSVVFQKKTAGDFKKWTSDIEKEIQMLQLKLSINKTKFEMLNNQEEIIKAGSAEHRRQRPGFLFTQKTNNSQRISLKTAVNHRRPKNTEQISLNMGLNPSLLDVNPENSLSVHFHVPWSSNDNRTYPAVLRTDDGGIIIPNAQNYIGITEIENAFLAMRGVDTTLISKMWISNHYRWIVWKLASMERNYPDIFNNYFSVENILNQLKYRYDREIDRAQRPAIRKIVECDDTAAKRMVLCVAAVIKLSENKYELELTDGWYSIKTCIDIPLNSLVEKNVIKVGMKLMIQGAELLNCEGCSPLELPSNVRLQIHYNSTRRAAWYTKLGYQSNPGPLRISLRIIVGNGGPVGGVCAYLARVYPISYMERCDTIITWRNQRAEIRRANQWEASYANKMETLQIRVQQELEREWTEKNKIKNKKLKIKDVKGVQCGRTLYQFMEESNDPDSVKELLTPSQISALQDYQSELTMQRQAELTSRLRQKLSTEKLQPRNVTTVLKLLLVDVQSTYHHRMFSIWKPTESHTQLLKEGIVMNIYNVAVKNNGTLSSIPRTQFEQVVDYDLTKFENLTRYVLPIYQTMNRDLKPQFGEFDTVGMVVRIDIKQITQFLWIVDEKQRFLLIKIRDGIESCRLFDGISPGKVIAVLNLTYQKSNKSYGEAFGNFYTVISSYPQQLYLQEFMHEFIENLPENVEQYLEDCKMVVEQFTSSTVNLKHGYVLNPENNSEIDSDILVKKICGIEDTHEIKCESLTLSDEEMALIDTQIM